MTPQNIPEIDLERVASLARLDLTPDELHLFQAQLGAVLEYANKLREADTSSLDAADNEVAFDVLREDEPLNWFTAAEALSNAPRQANDLFIVPKVIE